MANPISLTANVHTALPPVKEKTLEERKVEGMLPFFATLKNQNVGNEVKPGEMMAAMAAITNQNAMYEMQQGFKKMETVFLQNQRVQSGHLIGQDVTLNGNFAPLEGILSPKDLNALSYTLPQNAEDLSIDIVGQDGNVVRTLTDAPTSRGMHTVKWDGMDNSGNPVAEGTYAFNISATDKDTRPLIVERGDDIRVGQIYRANFNFILPEEPASVLVDIQHPEYGWVQTIDLSKESTVGENVFQWDGKNIGGITMPAGEYTFQVRATSKKSSQLMNTQAHAHGKISAVDISGDDIMVRVGDKLIPQNQIMGFGQAAAAA